MNLQTEINPELWRAIAQSYESGIYKSAILESIHYLSNTLREKGNCSKSAVANELQHGF
jgi:hypothetical protein